MTSLRVCSRTHIIKYVVFSLCYGAFLAAVGYFVLPRLESTGARISFYVVLCTCCLAAPSIMLKCLPFSWDKQGENTNTPPSNVVHGTTTGNHPATTHTHAVDLCIREPEPPPPPYTNPPSYDEIE